MILFDTHTHINDARFDEDRASVIENMLEKGVKLSGATVHIVTPECDAGPIVLQKAVEVKQDDTPETLQRRIMEEAEWKILPEAVRLFCNGLITVENNKVYIKGE